MFRIYFVKVREKDLSVVISTLEEEFNIYKEVGGESVPMHSQDVFNGLQKNGREGKHHMHSLTSEELIELISEHEVIILFRYLQVLLGAQYKGLLRHIQEVMSKHRAVFKQSERYVQT